MVSVSGRGTSVSAVSSKGRPQNSRSPRIRATGSRARRRAVQASSREASSPVRLWAGRMREFACADIEGGKQKHPRIEGGVVEPGRLEFLSDKPQRPFAGDAAGDHAAWSWSASWAA